jgi:ribosomal protein S18 acetylase RimI-like enzyme
MATLRLSPPVSQKGSSGAFQQLIELLEGERAIAHARWMCGGDVSQGVVQILELTVPPEQGRRGHGRILMNALTEQARDYFQLRKSTLRRVWMAIEQEGQVIGRSFLMKFGFHHVGTVHELLDDEDMLIYMRTFN